MHETFAFVSMNIIPPSTFKTVESIEVDSKTQTGMRGAGTTRLSIRLMSR